MRWVEDVAATVAILRALYVSRGKLWDGFWAQPHQHIDRRGQSACGARAGVPLQSFVQRRIPASPGGIHS